MCVITTREDEIAALESASVTKELKPFQRLTNSLSYSRRCDDTFSNRQGGGGRGPLAGGGALESWRKKANRGEFNSGPEKKNSPKQPCLMKHEEGVYAINGSSFASSGIFVRASARAPYPFRVPTADNTALPVLTLQRAISLKAH